MSARAKSRQQRMTVRDAARRLIRAQWPILLVFLTTKSLWIIVAALTRAGRALIPSLGTQFRSGDVLHLVVLASAMERLEALLDLSAGGD